MGTNGLFVIRDNVGPNKKTVSASSSEEAIISAARGINIILTRSLRFIINNLKALFNFIEDNRFHITTNLPIREGSD